MNVNTTAGIDAATREVAAGMIVPATEPFVSAAKPDTATMLDWILEVEQRLRIARLRIVIEGDHVITEVYEALADVDARYKKS